MNFSKEAPRILVTRTDRIGDLVLSTPVFPALRRRFPRAYIAALTFTGNREILEGNPFIDELILYDKTGSEKGLLGNLLFAGKLARRKFDVVIHLHATNRMHWVTFLAGIPMRIGWNRRAPYTLTRGHPDIKAEGKMHEAEYNFELLKPLGIEKPEKLELYFPVTPRAAASLEELLFQLGIPEDKPCVLLSPSASCPSKRWPAERFAALAALIRQKYDVTVALIGGPADAGLSRTIREKCAAEIHDLTGSLSLGMLGALLERSALLISNDSGPVHIACAVKTPVVSIFGRNQAGLSPARWGPLGENSRIVWKDVGCTVCLAHDCQIGFLCLEAISAEEVLNAAASLPGPIWKKPLYPPRRAAESGTRS